MANNILVPQARVAMDSFKIEQARAAMDSFKMEAASQVGVNLKQGYKP